MGTTTYLEMLSTLKKLDITDIQSLKDLSALKIAEEHNIESYYIPFDYVTPNAKIVLVGITPGKTQLLNALYSVKKSISNGKTTEETLKIAKNEGAFSGTLRKNLIRLLDGIELHKKLGLKSTASLFDNDSDLVHTTSVLRHPIFINGENYNGTTPNLLKTPLMLNMMNTYLKDEIKQLPDAIYIPLGPKVSSIFEKIISEGILSKNQVLIGLPHPSGANAERIAYFLNEKEKEELSIKTNPDLLDKAKAEILNKLNYLNF